MPDSSIDPASASETTPPGATSPSQSSPNASRWDRTGRVAAYGAALALTPYAIIKTSWVIGSLLGVLPVGAGFSLAGWVLLNTATIGMAVAGIGVALSLVRPWGLRIPGSPLAFCAWVAVGFLVPVLPYAVLSALLQPTSHPGSHPSPQHQDASMPGWEAALIQIGFIGMGLGLALGLPAYLRRRWPGAFALHVVDAGPRSRRRRAAVVIIAAVGVFWLGWTAGVPFAVAHREERDASWRILYAISGAWALALGVAVQRLRRESLAPKPRALLSVTAWIGSGTLFAWSGWKLAIILFLLSTGPADVTPPENLGAAAALHAVAVVASATVARALVRGTRREHTPLTPETERDMIAE